MSTSLLNTLLNFMALEFLGQVDDEIAREHIRVRREALVYLAQLVVCASLLSLFA